MINGATANLKLKMIRCWNETYVGIGLVRNFQALASPKQRVKKNCPFGR